MLKKLILSPSALHEMVRSFTPAVEPSSRRGSDTSSRTRRGLPIAGRVRDYGRLGRGLCLPVLENLVRVVQHHRAGDHVMQRLAVRAAEHEDQRQDLGDNREDAVGDATDYLA
jgi:hypothetical protein